MRIAFTVHGQPQPAGSKKAVPMGRGPNARWGVVDDNRKARPWQQSVAQAAGDLMAGRAAIQGGVVLTLRFFVQRPKGHFGARGNVRDSAPARPLSRPDGLKLARAVEDALSGIVYYNDSQIVEHRIEKHYGAERVEIVVEALDAAAEAAHTDGRVAQAGLAVE